MSTSAPAEPIETPGLSPTNSPTGSTPPRDLAADTELVFKKAPGLRDLYHRYTAALDRIMASSNGAFTPAHIRGKRVLDWECGAGLFSLIFLERGAARSIGIDSWLMPEKCAESMGHIPELEFSKISIDHYAMDPAHHAASDLIFANTVTEHMLQLPRVLTTCWTLAAEGGLLVLNHDNYYQPVGSHDHGFQYYGPGNRIVPLAPRCWEETSKCESSRQWRTDLNKKYPWTWDARLEARLTPQDCTACPYYKRAHPWAHLRHQHEFRDVFPFQSFTTGYGGSSLNKVTLFQLRQFVIEAGFDIVSWAPFRVNNEPPPELMAPPFNFSRDDLTTSTVTIVARKASKNPYQP